MTIMKMAMMIMAVLVEAAVEAAGIFTQRSMSIQSRKKRRRQKGKKKARVGQGSKKKDPGLSRGEMSRRKLKKSKSR